VGQPVCFGLSIKDGPAPNAQTALVQGVTDKNNNFTATMIGNDANGNLVDRTTGTGAYTADVTGSGVQFSNNGGQTSSMGVFVNHDANANSYDTVIQGSGSMSGFLFTFTNSKMEANQTAAGFFSFAGSPEQTGGALTKAGFDFHRLGENSNMQEYRSRGSFWTGANSAHFNVSPQADPAATVPTTRGDMHFGEHNPFSPFGWAPHTSEASQ
jgi:hypothetical protein